VSVDPLYRFSAQDIRKRIDETHAEVVAQTRKNMHEFTWTSISSVDELEHMRMTAMEEFLSDYTPGIAEGRYVDGELPLLPFADVQFDLAVCSHLLFLYSEQLSEDFHLSSIHELCRVAAEVRIFPLLELGARKSRHLERVTSKLRESRYTVSIVRVPYEFQKGGDQMMVVRSVEQAIAADCAKTRAGAMAALASKGSSMNFENMSENDILDIANPIMDNLMDASTKIDHARHIQDFTDRMKHTASQPPAAAEHGARIDGPPARHSATDSVRRIGDCAAAILGVQLNVP
jgi:hypothetical protein